MSATTNIDSSLKEEESDSDYDDFDNDYTGYDKDKLVQTTCDTRNSKATNWKYTEWNMTMTVVNELL